MDTAIFNFFLLTTWRKEDEDNVPVVVKQYFWLVGGRCRLAFYCQSIWMDFWEEPSLSLYTSSISNVKIFNFEYHTMCLLALFQLSWQPCLPKINFRHPLHQNKIFFKKERPYPKKCMFKYDMKSWGLSFRKLWQRTFPFSLPSHELSLKCMA